MRIFETVVLTEDHQMEQNFGNNDYELSNFEQCHGSTVRKRNISACLKFLLVALGLLLLCALVGICVLGILYYNKVISFESLNEQHTTVVSKMSAQEHKSTELKSQLDQVQLNYTQALNLLESIKAGNFNTAAGVPPCSVSPSWSETSSDDKCEAGWRSLGLKCYYFSTDKLNWMNSRDYCAENGAHLVIITSQEEQTFLSSVIEEHHWIGLNDLETEGKWMWVNNKSLTETGVEFWYKREKEKDEPDNWTLEDPSGENCARLGHYIGDTDAWYDVSCLRWKKYICEKESTSS